MRRPNRQPKRNRKRRWSRKGGVKQAWKEKRARNRRDKSTLRGRAIKWNKKALRNYAHCRTGKGRLGEWRHKLDPWSDPMCRWCGETPETGSHAALTCPEGKWLWEMKLLGLDGGKRQMEEEGGGWRTRGHSRLGGGFLLQVGPVSRFFKRGSGGMSIFLWLVSGGYQEMRASCSESIDQTF